MAFLRPLTTHVFNRLSRLFVRWLPGFGILVYRGRRSGATYRTPMNAFHRGDEWIFALTYSSQVQWVKNVMASGQADLEHGRRTTHLVEPRLFVDPARRLMPFPVRQFLGLMRVSEFLRMRETAPER